MASDTSLDVEKLNNREILKPTEAFPVRAFISFWKKFITVLRFFGDFLRGFSVSNRPVRLLELVLLDFVNCISIYPLNIFKHCSVTDHEFRPNIVKVAVD